MSAPNHPVREGVMWSDGTVRWWGIYQNPDTGKYSITVGDMQEVLDSFFKLAHEYDDYFEATSVLEGIAESGILPK